MSQTIQLFFALLRNALWRTAEDAPLILSESKTAKLFAISEQQAVLGLVADILTRDDMKIPQQWVYESIGVLEQIRQLGKIVNKGAANLANVLSANGVDYVIVKGQVVATYYPDALLRQSGDIDYFCDGLEFEKSLKAIREHWHVNPEGDGAEKHYHFDYKDVAYEVHFKLVDLFGKRRNEYFQKLIDCSIPISVRIEGQEIKTLNPTIHVLYVFLHLYNHLMKLGVGLRQFCDLAVMLHYAKNQINKDALREHLHALGMVRAYRACGSILVDQLGLSEEELGYTLTNKDRGYGRKILDVVMSRGNMGHYEIVNGEWQMVNGAVRSDKISEVRRQISAAGIKLSHFMKFAPLAPGYSCGWLWHEFQRNI